MTENGQYQLLGVNPAPAASIFVAPQPQTILFPTVLTEQQGHLWLKTENGQYQLLGVNPAPAANIFVVPQPQTILFPTVLTLPGVPAVMTSDAQPEQISGQMPAGPVPTLVVSLCPAIIAPATPEPQPPTATTHRNQLLSQSLDMKELFIEGINSPDHHMAFSNMNAPSQQPYIYYKTESNVAAMAEFNLAAQTQRILSSTELTGTKIRPFESKYLIPINKMKIRLKAAAAKYGFQEPSTAVAILFNHGIREHLKNLIEKLATIAHFRIDLKLYNDSQYEATQDVKAQLKFLEDLERMEEMRRQDYERQILMRVARSYSRSENPELLKLKARAKEMQRARLEEVMLCAANVTALQAIGPRKKRRLNGPDGSDINTSNSAGQNVSEFPTVPSKFLLRKRLQRINHRDMVFLMEQERETARPSMLYRTYLK